MVMQHQSMHTPRLLQVPAFSLTDSPDPSSEHISTIPPQIRLSLTLHRLPAGGSKVASCAEQNTNGGAPPVSIFLRLRRYEAGLVVACL